MPLYAEPYRLRVVKSFTAALEEISIASGYSHDLAGKVDRGRAVFGENDPLPMVAVLQSSRPIEELITNPENAGLSKGVLELVVQGFVALDSTNELDPAFVLSADIGRRIALLEQEAARAGYLFGMKSVYRIETFDPIVRPPDEISSHAYSWQVVRLHLAEDFAIPYDDA